MTISPDPASGSPCSAGLWLPDCWGSLDFYTKECPLSLTLLLKHWRISLYHFVRPSFHIVLPLNLLVCAVSKPTRASLVAQASTGLLKLAEVPDSRGTTEFGPQVCLRSISSLDTPVVPRLWSLGGWWSARAWKNPQLPVLFMSKSILHGFTYRPWEHLR